MKYISEFVKKMREIDKRSKIRKILWDSSKNGTYIKKIHGKLK